MQRNVIIVNGQEFTLGIGGCFHDSDNNVCGFVGSDIVKACKPDDQSENFADAIVSGLSKAAIESGAKDPRAGLLLTAPQMVVLGEGAWAAANVAEAVYEGLRACSARSEADEAEKRAKDTQDRLDRMRQGR